MGWEIHGRTDPATETYPEGVACRIWSTVSDGYITGKLPVPAVREFWLEEDERRIRRNAAFNNWTDERLERELADGMASATEWLEQALVNVVELGQSHSYYSDRLTDVRGEPWRAEL